MSERYTPKGVTVEPGKGPDKGKPVFTFHDPIRASCLQDTYVLFSVKGTTDTKGNGEIQANQIIEPAPTDQIPLEYYSEPGGRNALDIQTDITVTEGQDTSRKVRGRRWPRAKHGLRD